MKSEIRQLFPIFGWKIRLVSLASGNFESSVEIPLLISGVSRRNSAVLPLEIRDPQPSETFNHIAVLAPGKSITDELINEMDPLVRASKVAER